jgi:hypothetical protein
MKIHSKWGVALFINMALLWLCIPLLQEFFELIFLT